MELRPLLAGLAGRCPACGRGRLFTGFLTVTPRCADCGVTLVDGGEGPAVFIILIVGFLTGFGALASELAFHPPVWLHLVLWLPLAAILCLALMRPLKGLMVAAQFANGAGGSGSDGRQP